GAVLGDRKVPSSWPMWALWLSHLNATGLTGTDNPALRKKIWQAAHYLLVSGQPTASRALCEHIHSEWARSLGLEHRDSLSCAHYLAYALADLGDLNRARRIGEQTLALRQQTLGDDHEDTLDSASDLAVITSRLGQPQHALAMHRD